MAARENQGYLIAVIILVLLTLVLALAAFLGMSKASENGDARVTAESSFAAEKKISEANSIAAEILKAYVGGFGNSVAEVPTQFDSLNRLAGSSDLDANQKTQIQSIITSMDAVKAAYEKDMLANVGAAGDEAAQEFTWRSLIDNLSSVLAVKHGEYNVKVRTAILAEQEAQAKIAAKSKEVEQMQAAVETLEADVQKANADSVAKQKELTASLQSSVQELRSVNDNMEKLRMESGNKVQGLEKQVTDFTDENTTLKDKINGYEREVFDLPDGRVVRTASALNMVFIDLGYSDGLTENRSFAIYSQDVTNFEKGKHKATIEVTKVGEHQSEALVSSENPTNPILSGDYVLTATWDPGYAVPIALAGKFDLDNDGYSDLDKLIQMIKRNGGEVVAYHDEDGLVNGKIDSSVRYLVLGDRQQIGPDANPAVARAMDTMEAQAKANTVQVINLQKLLNRMGVRAQPKIEKIDQRISGFEKRDPSDSLKSADQ